MTDLDLTPSNSRLFSDATTITETLGLLSGFTSLCWLAVSEDGKTTWKRDEVPFGQLVFDSTRAQSAVKDALTRIEELIPPDAADLAVRYQELTEVHAAATAELSDIHAELADVRVRLLEAQDALDAALSATSAQGSPQQPQPEPGHHPTSCPSCFAAL